MNELVINALMEQVQNLKEEVVRVLGRLNEIESSLFDLRRELAKT